MLWVIEHTPFDDYVRNEWAILPRQAISEEGGMYTQELMAPRSFEACLKIALKESWNRHMHFRFRDVDTNETIPFELFPEIKQMHGK